MVADILTLTSLKLLKKLSDICFINNYLFPMDTFMISTFSNITFTFSNLRKILLLNLICQSEVFVSFSPIMNMGHNIYDERSLPGLLERSRYYFFQISFCIPRCN